MVARSLNKQRGGGGWFIYEDGRVVAGFREELHADLFLAAVAEHQNKKTENANDETNTRFEP
jgi:hypothetical protein